MRWWFVVALLGLSGCLADEPAVDPGRDAETTTPPGPPATYSSPTTAPATPWSVAYACGPGHDMEATAGCIGRLADESRTLGEPQVALHPHDEATFAIAVSDGRRPDGMVDDLPSSEPRGLAVYVTRDEGATFTRHRIDLQAVGGLPYNPSLVGVDPAIAFTPDGALHLAGLVMTRHTTPSTAQLETTLFTMRSTDLGTTWEAPVVLDDVGSNDREWLTTSAQGEVYVTWRDFSAPGSKFTGGPGRIDTSMQAVTIDGCGQISGVAWLGGVPLVACQERGDLVIYEATDESGTRGTAPGACPSSSARLVSTPTGALFGACYEGTVAISHDGGWNWTTPFDIFDIATVDDEWSAGIGPNIFAMEADRRGMVHLLLSRFPTSNEQLPTSDGRPVAHVVLDPEGTLVHEAELQPEVGSGPAGYGWADDYYDLEFVGGRGLMAWTSSDWATHYAILEIPL